MRVAVVGGKLQGVEACYLARKAGWHIRLVDRRPDVIARSLCDEFVVSELTRGQDLSRAVGGIDLILPALEDQEALDGLNRFCAAAGIPLAHDPRAYRLSSSKIASDRLFADRGIPAPKPWPEAGFPLIAKPSNSSGSRGIRIIRNMDQLRAAFPAGEAAGDWVVQEYLAGPSYSLEVVAAGGRVRCFQVTDLFMDAGHDCKRVTAPTELPAGLVDEFERIGRAIAEAIDLRGLMDVEVILNHGRLKVLEIDARLPSQTPTAVFWSSGANLVQVLGEAVCGAGLPLAPASAAGRAVVYEHIQVSPGLLKTGGEHMMASSGVLRLHSDFYGADEALTDYEPGRDDWRATLINAGSNRREAWHKRCEVLAAIRRTFGIGRFLDPEPSAPL
jgi:pyrrolysine biosynthesis protein PylC